MQSDRPLSASVLHPFFWVRQVGAFALTNFLSESSARLFSPFGLADCLSATTPFCHAVGLIEPAH
jgi:hypothetical protein